MLGLRNSIFLFCLYSSVSIRNQGEKYSLSYPNDQITYTQYSSSSIIPITESEYKKQIPCSFIGHGGIQPMTAKCDIELIEHNLVKKYITEQSIVLEIGGRYGTTSCTIAKQLNNNGNLVVIEIDYRIWNFLEINRQKHFCNFYFVKKPLGNFTMEVSGRNYDTISKPKQLTLKNSQYDQNKRPLYYNYHELEQVIRLKFNTLLIDCEGCIEHIFLTKDSSLNLGILLKEVKLIILEADNSNHKLSPCRSNCVDYEKWIAKFHEIGLNIVERVPDPKFPWIEHIVFQRS